MKSICVFTGSELGNNKLYKQAAECLGQEIAKYGINLVYGGERNGLMGVLADAVLKNGGTVTGVITHLLYERESHKKLTVLHTIETMHERKLMMSQLADGFITLPGGIGTLEELLEVWSAAKLRIHNKPIGLLNINNFYNGLLDLIKRTINEGFAMEKNQTLIRISDNPAALLSMLMGKAV